MCELTGAAADGEERVGLRPPEGNPCLSMTWVEGRGERRAGLLLRVPSLSQGLHAVPVDTCGVNLVASANPSELVCPAFSFEK